MTNAVDVNLINGIALAFEGDAVYSMYIRRHLIFQGQTKPNQLHRLATHYVSAKAQAMLVTLLLEENLLTEKEQEIYKHKGLPDEGLAWRTRCPSLADTPGCAGGLPPAHLLFLLAHSAPSVRRACR